MSHHLLFPSFIHPTGMVGREKIPVRVNPSIQLCV